VICLTIKMVNVMQLRDKESILYLRVIFRAFISSSDTTKKASAQEQNLIPSTDTGWAEKGLRAALRRRTWGCWLARNTT